MSTASESCSDRVLPEDDTAVCKTGSVASHSENSAAIQVGPDRYSLMTLR